MIRALIILAVILGGTLGVVWISEQQGTFSLNWMGYDIQTPAWVAFFALILLVGASYLVIAFLRTMWKSPERFMRFWSRKRELTGYEALTRGFVAVAAGDEKAAGRFASLAERKVNNPALTRLLSAQAAQLSGDSQKAAHYFTAMLDDHETAFLGHRGLIVQALRDDDKETALNHAQKALALKPKAQWVNTTLFDLQTDMERWQDARRTLSSSVGAKVFGKDVARRRQAVLLVNEAREALAAERLSTALERAAEAVKLSPGLVPAATLAAQLLMGEGARRKANKILFNAWHQSPHPDLAMAFLALDPEEDAVARGKRVKKLISHNPDHLESRMLLSEIAIDAQNWDAARAAISELAEGEPNARICTLMATIEKGEGGSEYLIRAWLARALTAQSGPQWVCSNCSWAGSNWRSECASCNAFDSLEWQDPPETAQSLALPASILPILTSAGEPSLAPEDVAEVEDLGDADDQAKIEEIVEAAVAAEADQTPPAKVVEAVKISPATEVETKEPAQTEVSPPDAEATRNGTPVKTKASTSDEEPDSMPQLSQRPDDPGPKKNGEGRGVPRY